MNRIAYAKNHLQYAKNELQAYLENEVYEAGSDYELADKTGIARSTIRAAMSRGSLTGLLRVAEKVEAAKGKKHKKNLTT